MKYPIPLIAALLLALPAVAGAPDTPNDCDDASKWANYLLGIYGKIRTYDVIVGNDAKGLIFVDEDSGEWWIMASGGEGVLCRYAYGKEWPAEWRK